MCIYHIIRFFFFIFMYLGVSPDGSRAGFVWQPYQKCYVWWVPRGPGDVSGPRWAQFANGKITSFNS